MQVGVEIEVLLDRQILVQAEPLGHVSDPRLNLLGIGDDIDAQNGQLPRVRIEQAGSQSNQRRFAGAIWSDQGG